MASCKPTEQDATNAERRYWTANHNHNQLTSEIGQLESQRDGLLNQILEKTKVLNLLNKGQEPKYVLTIKFAASRISLDIFEHMKDAANAGHFSIPVSKEFYDNVSIGTKLSDDFKVGSFIMNGSFSSWDIRISEKHIE